MNTDKKLRLILRSVRAAQTIRDPLTLLNALEKIETSLSSLVARPLSPPEPEQLTRREVNARFPEAIEKLDFTAHAFEYEPLINVLMCTDFNDGMPCVWDPTTGAWDRL